MSLHSQPVGWVVCTEVRKGVRGRSSAQESGSCEGQARAASDLVQPCPKPAVCCADLHSGHGGGGGVGGREMRTNINGLFLLSISSAELWALSTAPPAPQGDLIKRPQAAGQS